MRAAGQRFEWTPRAIRDLTWRTLEGEAVETIAARLGCETRTAIKMQGELDLRPRRTVKRWTAAEQSILRRDYAETLTVDLARRLRATSAQIHREAKSLGLRKSVEVIAAMARERSMRPGHGSAAFRFSKGHVPANKGLRRPGWAPGRMRETQFKKGERRGAANLNWRPVGTILPDCEGFRRIKVREPRIGEKPTGFPNQSVWPLLHRRVWEEHHGPIPLGHNIAFRDGDRANCAIENLEFISRAEQMRRNTIRNLPTELRDTIMLLGAVKRKLRKRSGQEHDDGSAQPSV